MNDKLRNHVDILFTAAPKTQRAAEVKEELLTNLNDKYNDLLANGYDQAAAFHIALSGIGDIDELFRECGGEASQPDAPKSSDSFSETCNSAKKVLERVPTPLLILLAVVLLLVPILMFSPFFFVQMCWLLGIALIVYAIIRIAMNSKNESFKEYSESFQSPVPPPGQPDVPPPTSAAAPTVRKKEPTSLLVLLAIVFFLFGSLILFISVFNGIQIDEHGIRAAGIHIGDHGIKVKPFRVLSVNLMIICWAVGIGLIIYAIVRSVMGSKDESIPVPWETFPQPAVPPPAFGYVTKDDITFKRIVAGILGILLGVFGIHKFYLGFPGAGLVMLLVTVFSCGALSPITWTIGFIEGVLYLLKTDRDFYRDYEVRRRTWF
jgi:TM2 domain-containing membrane protein YozV